MQPRITVVGIAFLIEILALVSAAPPDVVSATNPSQYGVPAVALDGYYQGQPGDYGVPQQPAVDGQGEAGGYYGGKPQGYFGGAQGSFGAPQGYNVGPQGYYGGYYGYNGGPQGYAGEPQGYYGGPPGYNGVQGYVQGSGPNSKYAIGDIRQYLIRYPYNPFMTPF